MNYSYTWGRTVRSAVCRMAEAPFIKVFSLFILCSCMFGLSASAQSSLPACSITGPGQAKASGADFVVKVKVANSTASPDLHYSFTSNSSKSLIKSTGAPVYDAVTNSSTQEIIITPGAVKDSEFHLKLKVATARGAAECSTSVSVYQ